MRPCVTPPLLVRGTEFGGPKPLFCIPLVAADRKQLLTQAEVARRLQADVVEWRADSYRDLDTDSVLAAAQDLRSVLDREPILFTMRISSEGGAQQIGQEVRLRCIETVVRSGFIDLVDLELSNGPNVLERLIKLAHDHRVSVILSFHDFHGTPSHGELFEAISRMISEGADIAKVACMPGEPSDVLRLLEVTLSARQAFPHVPLCTTSMGNLGFLSRVAGFLFGSDMAFAAGAAASAPGQIAIGEARALTVALLRSD